MFKWILGNGKKKKGEKHPEGESYPIYQKSRVRGETYTPYQGRTEWERAANQAMAEQARANFERKQSR